jgi:hypothetical protein
MTNTDAMTVGVVAPQFGTNREPELVARTMPVSEVTFTEMPSENAQRLIQRRLKLPAVLSHLLYEFLTRELITREELTALGFGNHPAMTVQRLRKAMDVTVTARRYTGFWIDQNERRRILKVLGA